MFFVVVVAELFCKAERAARSSERSREQLKELWLKNGYQSKKLSEEDEVVDDGTDEMELVHVVGDCSEASSGALGGGKVIVLLVNRSGVFGNSRFFASVLDRHGRSQLEESYERARKNKDLSTGDCHVIDSVCPGFFVALCVCVDGGGVQLAALKQSLSLLASWARRRGATVHCPRLSDWYSVLFVGFVFGGGLNP